MYLAGKNWERDPTPVSSAHLTGTLGCRYTDEAGPAGSNETALERDRVHEE